MNLNEEQKEVLLSLINNELNEWKTGCDTNILCEIKEAINYNGCCKPIGNCKITALVTYYVWEEAPHFMLDDTKHKITKIVEVEKLEDINEMFTNLIDVKLLK